MAHLYSHSEHFWHTMLRRVVTALDECMFDHFVTPLASNAPTSIYFADAKIVVDSTFVPIPKNTFVPADYHKKSPTKAAWKYEIACDFTHRIISCSKGFHGGAHDMRIFRESGLLNQSSDTALIMGDKGYKGKLGIVIPASQKANVSKEVKQLEDEKQRNHELETERAAIENINQRVKQWAVAREVWEGIRRPELFFDPSDARCVCVDECYPAISSSASSRACQSWRRVCIINCHRTARSQTQGPETVSSVRLFLPGSQCRCMGGA